MTDSLRKHVRRTAKHFDRQAAGYDRSHTVRRFQSRALMCVLSYIDLRPGMCVLDLGCGTGSGTLEIARRVGPSGMVVGLDASSRMIEEAERKSGSRNSGNVSFVVGPAEDLDQEQAFDVAICTNAFHHFLDKASVFRRVLHALRPGGTFLIEDICNDSWKMRALDWLGRIGERAHVGSARSSDLKRLMESEGFVEAAVEHVRLTWLWEIMIGQGRRPGSGIMPYNGEGRTPGG